MSIYDFPGGDDDSPPLVDRNHHIIKRGQFFNYLREGGSVPPGPYRYEGFRHGAHVFSIVGNDILASDVMVSEWIELIPDWKRWRTPRKYFERVMKYWEERRKERERLRRQKLN